MNRNPQFGGGINDLPPPTANRTRQQSFLFVTHQGIMSSLETTVEYSFSRTDELIVFALQL